MKNTATLLGYYGGDERTCLSAWQSTNIELGIELSPVIQERVAQLYHATVETKQKTPEELLKFLAENHHTSPFRKSHLDFQITADIATHIHCIKHRVGVEVNSESARYKELKDKWYLPEDWKNEIVDRYDLSDRVDEFFDNPSTWYYLLDEYNELGHKLYHAAIKQLTPVLGRARAKESARYFLPYTKQIDFDMQFSFEAFINFQRKRNDPHAQKEVRDLAEQMLEQVRNIQFKPFEYSLKAFGY
jgi:thymidylate synthase (FAD)